LHEIFGVLRMSKDSVRDGEGSASVHTASKGAAELVWVDEFATREEAFARERQIKGWSRKKKEALIAGDWERVKTLARCRSEYGAPTG
jgi:predicted GIY-YIG superfamily endonuclease